MSRPATPDLQRLRLRLKLRTTRAGTGMTQREVAQRLDWSLSKVIRIETGRTGISGTDLKALLDLYQVDDPDLVAQLVEFGRGGRTQTWSEYRDLLGPEFLQFLGYESSATVCRQFEPVLIPGLLQTKAYAAAIARYFTAPDADSGLVERLVQVKLDRQRILDRGGVELHFLLDEAVIRRWIGTKPHDPSIMQEQLKRLKELNRRQHITIQVIPFRHGLHTGMRGPFVLLKLDGVEGWLLYEEAVKGSSITRDNGQKTLQRNEAFDHLTSVASKPDELDQILDRVLREMRR